MKKLTACHNATALKTDFGLVTPAPIPTALWYQLKTSWSIHPSLRHRLLQTGSQLSSPRWLPYERQKPGSACHILYSFRLRPRKGPLQLPNTPVSRHKHHSLSQGESQEASQATKSNTALYFSADQDGDLQAEWSFKVLHEIQEFLMKEESSFQQEGRRSCGDAWDME